MNFMEFSEEYDSRDREFDTTLFNVVTNVVNEESMHVTHRRAIVN